VLRITGLAGQLVISQLINIASLCLPGYLFQDRARKNLGAEDCRDFFPSDLFDETGDFPRTGVGKVGRLDGPDDRKAVAPSEIRPGVMVSEDPPVILGNRFYGFHNGFVKGCEPLEINGRVLLVDGAVFRVEATQLVSHELRVADDVLR